MILKMGVNSLVFKLGDATFLTFHAKHFNIAGRLVGEIVEKFSTIRNFPNFEGFGD